jgi:8-oxo-dGTP diphosphatase
MKDGKYFNVRVYGLIINELSELLIAEEFHYNTFMRKLPGGGLQFGEGVKDCLVRELKEELNIDVVSEQLTHFHTTDFFVQSAFNSEHQVIGIYYLLKSPCDLHIQFRDADFMPTENGEEYFKWISLENLNAAYFTFPVDKQVIEKLLAEKNSVII